MNGASRSEREQWRRRAACRGLVAEMFFAPEDDDGRPSASWSPEPAQAVCATCPVRPECLAWALATRQSEGVWGGATPTELRRLGRAPRSQAS